MAIGTIHKQNAELGEIVNELKVIRQQLQKFAALISEERLTEYKNAGALKKAYQRATRAFVPR